MVGRVFSHLERGDDAGLGVERNLPTAVADVRVVDVVQEDAFAFETEAAFSLIDVILELDATPVAWFRSGR
jgi:hypothetical protein